MVKHLWAFRCLSCIAALILILATALPASAGPPPFQHGVAMAVGASHACVLTDAGGVKCWGNNLDGRLGDGTTFPRGAPVDVVGLTSGVRAIAAGWYHTCALTENGGVKCWGDNQYGQVGNDTGTQHHTPVDVAGLTGEVTAIAAGWGHTCAVTGMGGLKCWGYNGHGELGDGTSTSAPHPVNVIGLASGVRAIAVGSYHSCALVPGGGVKCWGSNSSGEVGDGTKNQRTAPVGVGGLTAGVAAIVAGSHHTCALTDSGGMKCWGDNYRGLLGDGTDTQRSTPVDVSGLLNGVAAMGAGVHHTCAIANGIAKCWGDNQYGQLGDGTAAERHTPVDVSGLDSMVTAIGGGAGQTCALMQGGGVTCWGLNDASQLGDGTITQRERPVDVSGLGGSVTAVAAGWGHTCAAANGSASCWGWNGYGQVGDGTTTQRALPAAVAGLTSGLTAIVAGMGHTCAIVNGGAKCWGDNGSGQLGDGTTTDRSLPVVVSGLSSGVRAIDAGTYHTCALTNAGGVKCWGSNSSGQLGDGSTTQRKTPTSVSGLTSGVRAVEAGQSHSCAVTNAGGVKCWGSNSSGQLGDGSTTQRKAPTNVSGLTSGVTAVAAGASHTCALTQAGGVKCWGANSYGQLGDGTMAARNTPVQVSGLESGARAIAAGWGHTCAILTDGGVQCWGWNAFGQLGDGSVTSRSAPADVAGLTDAAGAIAVADYHTCVVGDDGHARCWGRDGYDQLGLGTITRRLTPVDVAAAPFAPYAFLPLARRE